MRRVDIPCFKVLAAAAKKEEEEDQAQGGIDVHIFASFKAVTASELSETVVGAPKRNTKARKRK